MGSDLLAYGPILYGGARLLRGLFANPDAATVPDRVLEPAARSPELAENDDEDALEVKIVQVETVGFGTQLPNTRLELRVAMKGLGKLDLWVRPKTPFDRLFTGRLEGLDDPAFEKVYAVETNDPHFAVAWLSESVRRGLLRAHQCEFRAARGAVVTRCPSTFLQSPELEAALAATRAFARGPALLGAAWQRLAEALVASKAAPWSGALDEKPAITWELDAVAVVIELVQGPAPHLRRLGTHFTRVRATRSSRTLPAFAVLARSGRDELAEQLKLEPPRRRFDGEHALYATAAIELDGETRRAICEAFAIAGARAVLRDEQHVYVYLEGLRLDADALRAVGRVVAFLASEALPAPYR